jgi:hypothetical protein
MRALFSDRLWVLKLVLAAACFSWLCHRARREIAEIDPAEEAVPVRPDWIGKSLHLGAKVVVAERTDGYDIDTRAGRAALVAPKVEGVKAGDRISALARIDGPRLFSATSIQPNPGYVWKRALTYGLSIGVLAACLWIWRDRLRLRLRDGLFRART